MIDTSPSPCPGTYEAFDKVNYRSPFRQPKNDHLSFGSSAGRWNPNETFVGQKFIANPGPGGYDPATAVRNIPGGAKTTTRRGVQEKHQGLGPGVYNVHGSTMHKMTYNVTGPQAARRAQGVLPDAEPPNIGGGSGGGISGTRARLGHSSGGAGANSMATNMAMWAQDRELQQARANAVGRATQKGWQAIQDDSAPKVAAVSCTTPAGAAAAVAAPAATMAAPAGATAAPVVACVAVAAPAAAAPASEAPPATTNASVADVDAAPPEVDAGAATPDVATTGAADADAAASEVAADERAAATEGPVDGDAPEEAAAEAGEVLGEEAG